MKQYPGFMTNFRNFLDRLNGSHFIINHHDRTKDCFFGEAALTCIKTRVSKNEYFTSLRTQFEEEVLKKIPRCSINGESEGRVSNTSNICFDCIDSTALLMALDLKGLACSNGSACSTGTVEASHVLLAMGLPQDKAHGSIRFSFGFKNKKDELGYLISTLAEVIEKLRHDHPLWKEAVNQ